MVALALLSIAVLADGAFHLHQWGPIAVFALITLACASRRPLRRAALGMVLAAWAYAGWTLLSALWADSPASAVEGAGRNLLYAGLVSLPLLTLPNRRAAQRMASVLTAGLAAVVVLTFVACLDDGARHFLAGRLDAPVGYRNGTAALFVMAFWPLGCFAAGRDSNPLLRAGAFSAATTALGLAFLTQSRGVLLGFACGAVVAVALGPDRVRRTWLALMAVAGVAIASPRMLAPYDAFIETSATSGSAVADAMTTLAVLAAASFAAALVLALFDNGLRVSDAAQHVIGRLAAGTLGVLTVAALVGGLLAVGNPVRLVQDKVQEFEQLEAAAPGETRLGSTGGPRYDLWRIAMQEFRSAPLLGVGEGSYPRRYYVERRTDRNLSNAHSLPIGALAETGLVGLLLLTSVLVAAAVALIRGWRSTPLPARRWASALVASAAVLLGQAIFDWLWLIPALAGIALTCLALGVALVVLPESSAQPLARRRAWDFAGAAVPVVAVLLVGAIYLSDLYVRLARVERGGSPAAQLSNGRTAERLNPVALAPRYLQASALETLARREEARRELRDALEIEPENFVTMGLLGDLEVRAGDLRAGRVWYRRALARNPRDVGLRKLASIRD